MTYIKLEDVLHTIYSNTSVSEDTLCRKINSLPSINPEEIIEEMIKQFDKEDKDADSFDAYFNWLSVWKSIWLKRLLPKFKS